jgi:hypothetical protein
LATKFVLYSSEGCHLCEQALVLCDSRIERLNLQIVDIVEDELLVEQYGVHIPVLKRCSDDKALYWPFNIKQIDELIS